VGREKSGMNLQIKEEKKKKKELTEARRTV
jgi:hypothetical protein